MGDFTDRQFGVLLANHAAFGEKYADSVLSSFGFLDLRQIDGKRQMQTKVMAVNNADFYNNSAFCDDRRGIYCNNDCPEIDALMVDCPHRDIFLLAAADCLQRGCL